MNSKTIINVAGLSGYAGSSAITEWLRGNSECFSFGEYEVPIFRGDGGLLELYQLIQTGDVFLCSFAVEKFILMRERIKCELLLSPSYPHLEGKYLSLLDYYKVNIDVDDALSKIWNEFLSALFIQTPTKHIFGGFLKGAVGLRCKNYRYPNTSLKNIAINILIRLAEKLNGNYYLATEYNASQKSSYYFVKHYDKQKLKKSINILLNEFFNLFTKKRIVVCEQFVYPQTAIMKYDLLDNVKHILVQRDLRDVFVLCVRRGWICDDDVESFIATSKMRCFMKKEDLSRMQNVKLVRFEDFVLDHEKETDVLCGFLNISQKGTNSPGYDLEYSKSRIGLYKTYPNQKIISKIESELSNFICSE